MLVVRTFPSTFVVQAFSEKDDLGPYIPVFYLSVIWETASDGAVPLYIDPFTVLRTMTAALRKPYDSVTNLCLDFDVAAEPKDRIRIFAELFSNFNNLEHLYHISPSTLPYLLSYFEVLSQPNHMVVGDDSEANYSNLLPLMNSISFLDVNFASSLHPSNPNLLKKLLDFVTIRLSDLNVSPIACMTFQDCLSMSKNGINRLTNVGVRLHLDESTCNNCDIRSAGPSLFGWRILFPLKRVE